MTLDIPCMYTNTYINTKDFEFSGIPKLANCKIYGLSIDPPKFHM